MNTLFIFYVSAGILLVLLSLPLLFEKIKPNSFYGVRVPATLKDPAVWYAVNKYCAQYLIAVGVIVTVAAVALYLLPNISVDTYALSVLGVFVAAFGFTLFQTWRYLQSLR